MSVLSEQQQPELVEPPTTMAEEPPGGSLPGTSPTQQLPEFSPPPPLQPVAEVPAPALDTPLPDGEGEDGLLADKFAEADDFSDVASTCCPEDNWNHCEDAFYDDDKYDFYEHDAIAVKRSTCQQWDTSA